MRCLNCGTWNGDDRSRRCSSCGTVLEPVPDHLTQAIVAALLFPLAGLVSVYFSVRTNRSLAAGDYYGARENSRIARAWARAVFWFELAALLFFGVIFLLDAISGP